MLFIKMIIMPARLLAYWRVFTVHFRSIVDINFLTPMALSMIGAFHLG